MHIRLTLALVAAVGLLAFVGCDIGVFVDQDGAEDTGTTVTVEDASADGGESTYFSIDEDRAGPGGGYSESETYQLKGGVVGGTGPTRSESETYELESFPEPKGDDEN